MHFYVFLRTSSVLFILCAFILLCFTSSHVLLDKMQITLWHRKLAQKCWRAASVVSRKEMSFCRSPNARSFANRQVTTKSRSLCTSTLCIVYPVPLFFFPVIIVIYFIYICICIHTYMYYEAILTKTVPCFCTSCHGCTDDTVILSVGRFSRANNKGN